MRPLIKYNAKLIRLNELQKQTLIEINNKIASDIYKYTKNNCACGFAGELSDMEICSHDRFGMTARNVVCKNCGLIRLDPHLDQESLALFYRDHYRRLYTGLKSSDNAGLVFNAQYITGQNYYNYIKSKIVNIDDYKNVLEIGCSSGGILKVFSDKGHQCVGYDYDHEYIKYGNDKGLNLINGGIDSINENGGFDLVIASHVLEHLPDINTNINKILNLIKPNGILFIAVPGLLNQNYYVGKRASFQYWAQAVHLWWFSYKTLSNVMIKFPVNIISGDEKINMLVQKTNSSRKIIINNQYSNNVNFILKLYKYRILENLIHKLKIRIIRHKIKKLINMIIGN